MVASISRVPRSSLAHPNHALASLQMLASLTIAHEQQLSLSNVRHQQPSIVGCLTVVRSNHRRSAGGESWLVLFRNVLHRGHSHHQTQALLTQQNSDYLHNVNFSGGSMCIRRDSHQLLRSIANARNGASDESTEAIPKDIRLARGCAVIRREPRQLVSNANAANRASDANTSAIPVPALWPNHNGGICNPARQDRSRIHRIAGTAPGIWA